MRKLKSLTIAFLVTFASSGHAQTVDSSAIQTYLKQALGAIKQYGLFSDKVNWLSIDARAKQLAKTAKSYRETYPLIRDVIAQMGERHTFLLEPEASTASWASTSQADPWFGFAQDRDGRVSYVDARSAAHRAGLRMGDLILYVIPVNATHAQVTWRHPNGSPTQTAELTSSTRPVWFPTQGETLPGGLAKISMYPISILTAKNEGLKGYATQTQQLIRQLQSSASCGWVVDLRFNGGGTSFAMSMGIGPLLDSAAKMFFKGKMGLETVTYKDGQELRAKSSAPPRPFAGFQVDQPVKLAGALKPVAVLQGPMTASSGEATLLLFKGRPKTRFFGADTAGFTTGNSPLMLPDGATLVLTTSRMLDRTGTFHQVLSPDEVITPATDPATGQDLVLQRAQDWLRKQCTKRG